MEPSSEPSSHVLDLYKLSVDMADRISARRATANSFFLTLHTGLAAFVGIVGSVRRSETQGSETTIDSFGLVMASIVGIVLAGTWLVLLRSYRDLNSAKFAVINKIEEQFEIRPFTDEWAELKKDPVKGWRGRYAELGFVERSVPIVFMAVYLTLGVRTLLR